MRIMGNDDRSTSYLEIAKGLIQELENNVQPSIPPKRRQPNARTKKAPKKGQRENPPAQSTHPQGVTQPIQSHPPEGPKEPAGDKANVQPQTEASEGEIIDNPNESLKDNPKETLGTDAPNQDSNASEQITDNQESIIEIQDTPMEGQEHEGGEKRSTEERSPSISQDLSPTKKSKRQTQPPQRMLDYETGEATA